MFKRKTFRAMIGTILTVLVSNSTLVFAESVQELNTWTYHKEWDQLSNLNYSMARSPLPKRGLYDNLRLEIVCKANKLLFVVDANSLITSQNRAFDFEYQIDKNDPILIQMRTYPDTKRRGFTDQQVENVVQDILSGRSIFIRIHTLIRTVLSGAIPLDDAAEPIQSVLNDCGIELSGNEKVEPDYTLDDFERDFAKLTPERQREILSKIKQVLDALR
ncbi:MAG: hypothetical protein ACU85E_14325 [Gammaproteobacteria bacterium]